jgi:hypothetical protein
MPSKYCISASCFAVAFLACLTITLDVRQLALESTRSEQTAVLNTALLMCRATLKDAVKSHSIHTGIDTSYEDFQEQLSSQANEETQNIKEHSK